MRNEIEEKAKIIKNESRNAMCIAAAKKKI